MSFPSTRRTVLAWLATGAAMPILSACDSGTAEARTYPVNHSAAEWRRLLTPAQFHVLREAGTERSYSSPLNDEHRKGTFFCAADGNALFSSTAKFDSHTGWPSFTRPLPGGVETSTDYLIGIARTEVHCTRCGGHLGHVFDDGPPPTNKRYCMNGVAMTFKPA